MKLSNVLLSLSLATGVLWLAGCSDPDLCKRGEAGCACRETGNECDDGDCTDGMCPAAGSGGSGGTGGTAGTGGTGGTAGTGGTGGTAGTGGTGGTAGTGGTGGLPDIGPDAVCTPSATGLCVARAGDEFPEDAQTACEYFCELFCMRKEQWCPTDRCVPGFCDASQPLNGVDACLEAVADDADVARTVCRDQDLQECPDVDCGGESPDCPLETTCLMDCGSEPPRGTGGQWAQDGVCDDGGDGAEYHECEWGHDCEGCGVRYGVAPACTELSGCCRFTNDCCGGFEGDAHCLGDGTIGHCRYACTRDGMCPTGFECVDITRNGVPTGARACIPD